MAAPTRHAAGETRRALCASLLGLLLLAGCADAPGADLAAGGPDALAALAVGVEAPADSTADGRTAFLADGAGGTWFGAVAGPDVHEATGYRVGGAPSLAGWSWWLDADSLALSGVDRRHGLARPDLVARAYAHRDSASTWLTRLADRALALVGRGGGGGTLTEHVALLDGAAGVPGALVVEVPDSVGTVGFRPLAADRTVADAYTVERRGPVLLFARKDQIPDSADVAAGAPVGAVWTAVAGGTVRATDVVTLGEVPDLTFSLGEVAIATPGRVAVATGATREAAAAAALAASRAADRRLAARQERLAGIVDALGFEAEGDDDATRAVRWAALTLDALAVRDSSRLYLQPGVPGASPASFPSVMTTMPAWLATGRWADARALLVAVGAAQRFDGRLDLMGRAPDLVPAAGEPVFATAEGTALFLDAAGDYVRATGDRAIVSSGPNFWFKTVFALDRGHFLPDRRNGNALDTLGLLRTTQRRGTWLDAPDGWRRTGSPAEAQGALLGALHTARDFAEIMGVSRRAERQWVADTSRHLVRLVDRVYGSDALVADRVEGVGQPTADVRPGGLLLLARVPALPRRAERARALGEQIVYPYGVASLAQTDTLFNPWEDPDGTRGAVWTWLAGPTATLMAETGGAEPAAELLAAQADLMLERGTVGALPERLAAHPDEAGGAPELAGAPVQPWSVATYLAGVYEGLLGVGYPHADTLALAPRLPADWGATRVRLRLGGGAVRVAVDGGTVEVTPEAGLAPGAVLRLTLGGATAALPVGPATDSSAVRAPFTVEADGGQMTVDGEAVDASPAPATDSAWEGFAFAVPDIRERSAEGDGSGRRALSPAAVLRDDLAAEAILTQTDPDGDDWGATSTFTYPTGWPAGVLDATYLELARDDEATYVRAEFTALADPGRTVVAVIFDTAPGGARLVGRNARYALDADEGYEIAVFAGATGLVVEDAGERTLARLDEGSVFDPEIGSLAFALPVDVVPRLPRGTRVTLLVGALDGEANFLGVEREASDDAGGGRVDPAAPNVYDVVLGRTR